MAYFDKYGVEFADDRKTLVKCPRDLKGEYVIPDGVTSIGNSAFLWCEGLTSITIPNSVTSIENYAFAGCEGLTSIIIPNSVTSIEQAAFDAVPNIVYTGTAIGSPWGAKGINGYVDGYLVYADVSKSILLACSTQVEGEIVIPNSVTSIGNSAFAGCEGLTAITIPNGVTSIGDEAFWCCKGLTAITIPNSVTSIGNYAFAGCSSLPVEDNLRYADTYLVEAVDNTLSAYTIKEGTKWIGRNAFKGCTGLTSITIPNGVTSIGDEAFEGCTSLTSITIPNSVRCIGLGIFRECSKLKYITLPNSITQIGKQSFYDCTSLEEITLSQHLSEIPDWCFRGCENLKSLSIPPTIKAIGTKSIIFCKSLTSLIIPEGVTSIKEYAIWDCRNLRSITLPHSLQLVEKNALYDLPSLKEVCIPYGQRARFMEMGLESFADIIVERDNEELTILFNLAKAYEFGVGISQSIPQALVIYIQAAEKGSAEAAYHLGKWYEEGEYVPQDLPKALEYFLQAAKSGFFNAQKQAERVQTTIVQIQAEEQRAEELRKQEEGKRRKIEEDKRYAEQLRQQQEAQRINTLFFDTETTGVPWNYKAPVSNTANWPRLVQLAWIITDNDGHILKRKSVIIQPNGFIIPNDAASVHGITTERAQREGQPLYKVLEEFYTDLNFAEKVVGHNIDFDQHIVGAEMYRLAMDYDLLMKKTCICTMKSTTDYCAIPNPNTYHGGYKWPSLQELYRKLFGCNFDDAHDALADITATKECFFELRKRRII